MLEAIRYLMLRMTMGTTPSLEELDASLARATEQRDKARNAHAAARTQYVAVLGAVEGESSDLTRHRKRLRDAEHALQEAEERVTAMQALRERVASQSAEQELARRLDNSRSLARSAEAETEMV